MIRRIPPRKGKGKRGCPPSTLKSFFLPCLIAVVTLYVGTTQAANTEQVLVLEAQEMKLSQLRLTPVATQPSPTNKSFLKARPQVLRQGNQVSLNGRKLSMAWSQWQLGTAVHTGISDADLMQKWGLELLNTGDVTKQPVQWFTQPATQPLILATQLIGSFRYLDLTNFAQIMGWQLQVEGTTLLISSAAAQIAAVQPVLFPEGERIIVSLDRPTPWQITKQGQEWVVTIDGTADPSVLAQFKPPPLPSPENPENQSPSPSASPEEGSEAIPTPNPTPLPPPLIVESVQNQTRIRGNLPAGLSPRVWTISNPNRLVIDLQPEAMVERDILWAPGIRWRQQYVQLPKQLASGGEISPTGTGKQNSQVDRFPVTWLLINPRSRQLSLKPIWSNPTTQTGIAPLIQTAQIWQASAAVNAGFFNRNNQLPLGAIRRDRQWLSGPILNRGAIAWNNQGQVKMERLTLQETLITSAGERLPILFLNSGYVKAGIARYTPEWGPAYTPLTDNEVLVVVQNNQVMGQLSGGLAGKTTFPISADGYLLAIRATPIVAGSLIPGTMLGIESQTLPAEFNSYPQVLGAGPLLLKNRQIVLDAKAENFSDAFIREAAIRSVVGTTPEGNLMIVAVHNRTGGKGPTLAEVAQLMQRMGVVDALNFDGGSSTSLYLGGQLLNRPAYTAARVHNGLGIFLQPDP